MGKILLAERTLPEAATEYGDGDVTVSASGRVLVYTRSAVISGGYIVGPDAKLLTITAPPSPEEGFKVEVMPELSPAELMQRFERQLSRR